VCPHSVAQRGGRTAQPKTNATVEQLIPRYLDKHFDGDASTRTSYRQLARRHVLALMWLAPLVILVLTLRAVVRG
jgi:hypothetical protein